MMAKATESDMLLKQLLKIKTETQNLDFKKILNWKQASKKDKLEIVKDVLLMANVQDGGHIVIGKDLFDTKVSVHKDIPRLNFRFLEESNGHSRNFRETNIMNTLIKKSNYAEFLQSIKSRIRTARISAARTVNKELLTLYWSIGKDIVEKQEQLGWGKSVVEQLSKDLKNEFPGTEGFSVQNLWRMRLLYLEYQEHPKLAQLVREIPWGQNILILQMIKDWVAREYYLKATVEMGWSRNVLLNQIKADACERHRLRPKQHNFEKALPDHLAEQADKAMKDVYMLDFLGITKPVVEREMENRMVAAIKDVLLELGYGFAFLGNQYRIKANKNEYFIDLLFFHRKLNCLVAFELKTGRFQPEYAGKMNFYLNLLDDYVREEDENPSIGIILCADRDHFEVEYALRGIQKPVGVAEYKLTTKLPKKFEGKLPDAKTLKQEILKELKEET